MRAVLVLKSKIRLTGREGISLHTIHEAFVYCVADPALVVGTTCQWLSGRVLDSRPKGRGFEPHRRHCVVVLEQDTFILA